MAWRRDVLRELACCNSAFMLRNVAMRYSVNGMLRSIELGDERSPAPQAGEMQIESARHRVTATSVMKWFSVPPHSSVGTTFISRMPLTMLRRDLGASAR